MKHSGRKSLSNMVLKAMGIFGGVQSLSIICSVIRMKFVALWIGVAGVGLFSIFNSAIDLISTATQLSIRNSAVRDLAASGSESMTARGVLVAIVRRWGWLLGMLGALVMLITAPVFSSRTFGDYDHTWQFILLSVCVFLSSVTSSESAILQGLKRYKSLAMASLWGVFGGLTISLPFFYFLKIDSIIPSLIAYSASIAVATQLYRARDIKSPDKVSASLTLEKGKSFIILGGYLTAAAFINQLFNYIFIAYLNKSGTDYTVGLYQAGNTLVTRYVGLVFTALAMEYYPRLSNVSTSRRRTTVFVSHEIALIMIILLPILCFFIPAAKLIVKILYSESFTLILPFIVTAMPGMVFRGISWCMSYVVLARGDGRTFVVTEVSSSIIGFALNVLSYNQWGINGLGISFSLWYVSYTVIMAIVYVRGKLSVGRGALCLTLFTLTAVTLQVVFFFYTKMWVMITFAVMMSIIALILLLKISSSKFQ